MRFFLGSNTPRGFVSHFQSAYDVRNGWKVWVIKGGAGTGKSSMMKKIAKAAERVTDVQWIYCSSDPDSLDAVVLPEKKRIVLDGTAPHIVEPRLVGACENIVNVGAFWDSDYLYSKAEEIFELNSECSRSHAKASRYINAANTFNRDSVKMLKPYLDTEKALEIADNLANREFGGIAEANGKISIRLVSAVTPKGIMFFDDSISKKCERIIGIKDDYSVVAPVIMERLAERAVECGHDITVCPCSMSEEKIEHIIIPSFKLAFTTINRYHGTECAEIIDANGFIDAKAIANHQEKIAFNSTAADGLFEEASVSMTEAKKIHDKLEAIYVKSMDFEPVNDLTQKMIELMIK